MEVIIGLQPGVPRIASTPAYAHKANVPISSARSRSSIYCHRLIAFSSSDLSPPAQIRRRSGIRGRDRPTFAVSEEKRLCVT